MKLRTEDLVWREVEDEIVALDLKTSNYIAINRTGRSLWPLLSEGASREALIEHLVQEFDVAADQAGHDVDAFIEALNEKGLIEE